MSICLRIFNEYQCSHEGYANYEQVIVVNSNNKSPGKFKDDSGVIACCILYPEC